MTCAACARVIERTLTRLPGVDAAAVNYATGRASVRFDPSLVQLPRIAEAVRDVGYEVIEAAPGETLTSEEASTARSAQVEAREYAALKRLFTLAVACGAPLVVLGMSHAQFPGVNWVQLALAVPVLFVAGRPLLPRRVVGAAAPQRRHEHAHRPGHRGGLRVLARGHDCAGAGGRPAHGDARRSWRPRCITRWRRQSSSSSCSDGCSSRGHARARRTRFDG